MSASAVSVTPAMRPIALRGKAGYQLNDESATLISYTPERGPVVIVQGITGVTINQEYLPLLLTIIQQAISTQSQNDQETPSLGVPFEP